MASIVLSTVGFAVAGPVGLVVGAAIGVAIDRSIFPGPRFENEGPRLRDLAVQSSAYGTPIPFCFGTIRMSGNIIWSTGLIERRMTESMSAGGKGGGGGRVTNTTYSYSVSFAVALCQREIKRIGKIWADGKLIQYSGNRLSSGGVFRVYTGSEDQESDPVMEAALGFGQVPAYRGLAYVVFEDMELAEFANRIPNLTFEVIADEGPVLVSTIAQDLAQSQEISSLDAGALTPAVLGYSIDGSTSIRKTMEGLSAFAPMTVIERGRDLIVQDLPQTAITVPYEDLGAGEAGERQILLERERIQDWELPSASLIHYLDPVRDYQTNVQRARRLHVRQANVREQTSAVAISASDAKRAAERTLNTAWTGRESFAFTLPLPWVLLEVGDFIQVVEGNALHPMLIGESVLRGHTVRLTAQRYDPLDAQVDSVGDAGTVLETSVVSQGATHLSVLDIPRLPGENDDAPTFLAALSGEGEGWRQAALFESLDEGVNYTQRSVVDVPTALGEALDALNPSSSHLWDEVNSVTVQLEDSNAELVSRPELALLNGANAALLGAEIIQFRNAVLQEDGRYVLSGLLRGRLGTEAAITTHMAGEDFILLDQNSLATVSTTLGQVGQTRLYKAVGPQDIFDDVAAISFTYQARALRPLKPVHVRAAQLQNGDISLSWIRRSRFGAEWIDGADAPLGEAGEAYEIDILNAGGDSVRTLTSSTSAVLYTSAQQMTDFGAEVSVLDIAVYQMSGAVGRGAPSFSSFIF